MANPIRRWWERRSLAVPSQELLTLFSSGPTESGMVVSPETALQVPAVFACVQVLSQDVARTPIRFRQQVAPGVQASPLKATRGPSGELVLQQLVTRAFARDASTNGPISQRLTPGGPQGGLR